MSRRRWTREFGNPITMFHEKRHGKCDPRWSMVRIMVFGLFVWFVSQDATSLGKLSGPAVALAAIVVFGLVVRDLFEKVPASEALGALQTFFGNVMGRAAANNVNMWGLNGTANDGAPGGDDA
jgi:hypothetical protein